MNYENKFKEVTGFEAYADNDLRPKVPIDYYVEWLEEQLSTQVVVSKDEQLVCDCGGYSSNKTYNNRGTCNNCSKQKI